MGASSKRGKTRVPHPFAELGDLAGGKATELHLCEEESIIIKYRGSSEGSAK